VPNVLKTTCTSHTFFSNLKSEAASFSEKLIRTYLSNYMQPHLGTE